MQQADKKEHTHRETGVGAEMRILKGMYCDSISGYFFLPQISKYPSNALNIQRIFRKYF